MALTATPTITPYPLNAIDEGANPVVRFNSMPTPAILKTGILFGIPLTSSFTGQTFSDEMMQRCINEAISEVEHVLDLYITPVQFSERHDYIRENFTWSYNYLKLNHPNILHVDKVAISFTNDPNLPGQVDFPLEFVHVMAQEGVIQLVPAMGTSLSGFLLSAMSGTQFHALRAIGLTNFPGGIRVKYTCGFKTDEVPAVLTALIETTAAMRVLSMLGPIFFPYNGTSIGIDGTSQSVSTLGPGFFRNRLDDLEKQKQAQMEAAKSYYSRRFLIDWF